MRNRKFLSVVLAVLLLSSAGCKTEYHGQGDNSDAVCPGFGIVVMNGGWLAFIDGFSQTTKVPLLAGELGALGGGLMDAAITPDGMTALVSNFSDERISFINTCLSLVPSFTPAMAPTLLGSLKISFFAEDIAITPNGRFALVTDGGFAPKIAVIDIASRTLVEEYDASAASRSHQAVAVTPDGQTVLTVDYAAGKVHVYTLSAEGHLSYSTSIDVSHGSKLGPVNVAIAPNGKTAVVASHCSSADDMGFPVLNITGVGLASTSGIVVPSQRLIGAQSIVFSHHGSKAYLNCIQEPDGSGTTPNNVIEELDIAADGQVSDGGVLATVDFAGTSQLFGVDTMAVDYARNWLYVSNMTVAGGKSHVQVIDLESGAEVKTIAFDPVAVGDPATDVTAMPTGVCFWN